MADSELQRTFEIGVYVAERHADVTAADPATGAELRQDRRRAIDGHGEADVAGARADGGIDADDFAARINQRPAAVAEVDRGVGLNVVVEAFVEQLASEEADHAHGHRVLVSERVADRAHPLAHAERSGCGLGAVSRGRGPLRRYSRLRG